MTDRDQSEVTAQALLPGLYRHFKGGLYRVEGMARHSENDEWLVLYRAEYAPQTLWARPLTMFTATVRHQGLLVPRFQRVDNDTNFN